MNTPDQRWSRLVTAARRAPSAEAAEAPYGFATRVAALGLATDRGGSRLEQWSWRALGVAALLAVVSVAGNYSTLVSALSGDSSGADDPVAEVVDLAS